MRNRLLKTPLPWLKGTARLLASLAFCLCICWSKPRICFSSCNMDVCPGPLADALCFCRYRQTNGQAKQNDRQAYAFKPVSHPCSNPSHKSAGRRLAPDYGCGGQRRGWWRIVEGPPRDRAVGHFLSKTLSVVPTIQTLARVAWDSPVWDGAGLHGLEIAAEPGFAICITPQTSRHTLESFSQ